MDNDLVNLLLFKDYKNKRSKMYENISSKYKMTLLTNINKAIWEGYEK